MCNTVRRLTSCWYNLFTYRYFTFHLNVIKIVYDRLITFQIVYNLMAEFNNYYWIVIIKRLTITAGFNVYYDTIFFITNSIINHFSFIFVTFEIVFSRYYGKHSVHVLTPLVFLHRIATTLHFICIVQSWRWYQVKYRNDNTEYQLNEVYREDKRSDTQHASIPHRYWTFS